jgi:hypothetical protein
MDLVHETYVCHYLASAASRTVSQSQLSIPWRGVLRGVRGVLRSRT